MPKPKTVNIHEAKTHFSKLLKRVARGEEIVIARAGQPVARLAPINPTRKAREPGIWKGLFVVPDNFDDPLPPDIQRYFDGEED